MWTTSSVPPIAFELTGWTDFSEGRGSNCIAYRTGMITLDPLENDQDKAWQQAQISSHQINLGGLAISISVQ